MANAEQTAGKETDPASEQGQGASSQPVVPEGFVSRDELDAAEARRRSFQAEADRLKRENAELVAARTEGTQTAQQQTPASGITLEQVRAELARDRALADARARVSQDYGSARPEVLQRDYATPEEMLVAARKSHEAEVARVTEITEKAQAAFQADFIKKNPEMAKVFAPAPQAPSEGGEGGKAVMSIPEWIKLTPLEKASLSDADTQRILSQ